MKPTYEELETKVLDLTKAVSDRKEIENELKKSKEEITSIFSAVPTGIGLVSNRMILQVNDKLCEITGYSQNELIGKNARILYPSHEDYEYVGQEKYRQISKNGTGTVETRFKKKSGKIIHILMSSTPINKKDLTAGVTFSVLDISKRKAVEKELRTSHATFLTVLNSIDATIYVSDIKTHEILFMNQSMIKEFGKDMVGKICWKAFRNGTGPCEHCADHQLVDEKGNSTGLYTWQDKNPITGKWYNNYDRAIEWTDGRMVKIQIATDITERKKNEEELIKSEERYREYFEEDISGMYISNPDGKLIACNKEYNRIFGFKNTDHAMQTPIDKLCVNSSERNDFLDLLKTEKKILGYKPNLKRIDGTPVHLLENSSAVFDEQGNLKHIRGFLQDVTEQKKLEKQLLQAQKMEAIGTLAGGIAHDFNNILGGIFGYTHLAKMQINEPKEVLESINQIVVGAERASTLIRQILTFSRQTEHKKQPINLGSLLKEAINLLRSSIPTNIEIKKNIKSKSMTIADPTQVHQVIMNLCTNAYHAMSKDGGILTIGLENVEVLKDDYVSNLNMKPGNYIKFVVSDTGHGINRNIMDRIFDPYFTTKTMGKGTGLGLALVDGIVKNHNGFLNTKSKINHGSTFEVFWPIFQEKNSLTGDFKEKEKKLYRGTEHILLVDDEIPIIETLEAIFKGHGYLVTSFTDGISAFSAFEKDPTQFDIVVTDMTMPKMTGNELAINVLKIKKELPIILCTGYYDKLKKEQALESGIQKYVQKPIHGLKLLDIIRQTLDQNKKKYES